MAVGGGAPKGGLARYARGAGSPDRDPSSSTAELDVVPPATVCVCRTRITVETEMRTNKRTPQPDQVPLDLWKDLSMTGPPQLTEDRRASGAKEILCGCHLEETVGTESS